MNLTADILPWQYDAACAQIGDLPFFQDGRGGSSAEGKSICRGCPVRQECLAYIMRIEQGENTKRVGIFGGLSPRERYKLAKGLAS